MQVVLMGITGSGKTTLAERLAAEMDIPHVSTGAIARGMGDNEPATRLLLERGDYAPEGAMRIAVKSALEEADFNRGGWVLDGFPRTMAQWVSLMQWTEAEPVYVHLDIPLHDALTRLLGRKRHDDIADAIAAKIDAHVRDTVPVIEMLGTVGALHTISALSSIEHQVESIKRRLA